MVGWWRVGFGVWWGLVIHGRNILCIRAGVELHETVILGKLEARKGDGDGCKVFVLANSNCRNFYLSEGKPKKKVSSQVAN